MTNEELSSRGKAPASVRAREIIAIVGVERFGVAVGELAFRLEKNPGSVSRWLAQAGERRRREREFEVDCRRQSGNPEALIGDNREIVIHGTHWRIPWGVPLEGGGTVDQPGWGTIRAYLESDPKNNMLGRFPADRFDVHNSNKGFSHGCIETSNAFFNRLLLYRIENPDEPSFTFKVHYVGESTRGATENAAYPPLIYAEEVNVTGRPEQ